MRNDSQSENSGRRLVICGGYDFRYRATVCRSLDLEHAQRAIGIVGDSTMVDAWAQEWAASHDVDHQCFPAVEGEAFWAERRNERLFRDGKPEAMIVFAGLGTFDMLNRAWLAHIPVKRIRGSPADVLGYVCSGLWERIKRRATNG